MGKLALVTGGTRGIGLATVLKLLEHGHTVIAVGRSDKVDGVIPDEYAHSLYVRQCDLADIESIPSFAKRINDEFGDVLILVNNAGVSVKNATGQSNKAVDTSVEEFNQTMSVNVLSPMVLTQQFLPGMQKAKWGRIVNVASLAGRSKSAVSGPAYMMSKAALLAWTRAVAQEMAPYGVVCNSLAPGRVLTQMAMQGGDALNQKIASATPVGRIGVPEEVAYAAAMLCSNEAAFTTGACLDINGGVFMS
jgi:3-oxoacyl-[acyl-carrier protein] reductase